MKHFNKAQQEDALPGVFSVSFIRLYDTPELRRRYIFELQTDQGTKASFYLSASGRFTYSITDINKEAYNIEIPVGQNGIPIDRHIFLYCAVGVSKTKTFVRVLVDGEEVAQRTYDFPMDLGKEKNWKQATVGADTNGKNNAPFQIAMFGFGRTTLDSKQISSLINRFKEYLRAIDSPIAPQ